MEVRRVVLGETGWTAERGVKQACGSDSRKEEQRLVPGGSAGSEVIGEMQKARRKPGPGRKNGPVSTACVDSRVRECNMFMYSDPAVHPDKDFYACD